MVNSIKIPMQVVTHPLQEILQSIRDRFPFLYFSGLANLILFLFCMIAMQIDSRELVGINVWIKPAKFALSLIIYLWTIGWYLLVYPFSERNKNIIANTLGILMIIEIGIIFLQAGRGVQSHYNESNPLDGILFGVMGLAIGITTIFTFIFFIKSFSKKIEYSSAMKWSFRLGWFAFIIGSWVGGQMIQAKAHNIGAPDGGEGLFFLNWSTEGGDLRAAHFFGLHAIQLIPLATYFFTKKIKHPIAYYLSLGFAIIYISWILLTFWWAKNGQPIITL